MPENPCCQKAAKLTSHEPPERAVEQRHQQARDAGVDHHLEKRLHCRRRTAVGGKAVQRRDGDARHCDREPGGVEGDRPDHGDDTGVQPEELEKIEQAGHTDHDKAGGHGPQRPQAGNDATGDHRADEDARRHRHELAPEIAAAEVEKIEDDRRRAGDIDR